MPRSSPANPTGGKGIEVMQVIAQAESVSRRDVKDCSNAVEKEYRMRELEATIVLLIERAARNADEDRTIHY
jgi:hypothetical protein